MAINNRDDLMGQVGDGGALTTGAGRLRPTPASFKWLAGRWQKRDHVSVNLTDQIAEGYVAEAMELDPVGATLYGVAGYDDRMADTSPEGSRRR